MKFLSTLCSNFKRSINCWWAKSSAKYLWNILTTYFAVQPALLKKNKRWVEIRFSIQSSKQILQPKVIGEGVLQVEEGVLQVE